MKRNASQILLALREPPLVFWVSWASEELRVTVEVLSDSGGLKHTFVMLYIYIHILYRYCTVHIVYMYHVYTEMIIPQLLLISYSMYAYIYICISWFCDFDLP